jgi:hypothetical protein
VAYAQDLPMKSSACSDYDLVTFVRDLIAYAKSHLTQNAIVIPTLQCFNTLIGADALDRLSEDQEGLKWFVGGPADNKMVLNACFQPPRASCPHTAKCSSPEECGEDPRIYEVVSTYHFICYSILI